MSTTIPTVKILDQGFKKVLQADDKIQFTEGETSTTMTLREYLTQSRFDKGVSPTNRLKKLAQMDGDYLVAGPLKRYAFQLEQEKPIQEIPGKPILQDDGAKGLLQPDDKVTLPSGDRTETVSAGEFITSHKYKRYGNPLDRRDLLSKLNGGLQVSPEMHQKASAAYDKIPHLIRINEKSGEGILQGNDTVTIKIGREGRPKEVPVQEFVFSEEFSQLGSSKERVQILAEMDGGRAVSWPLSLGSKYLD